MFSVDVDEKAISSAHAEGSSVGTDLALLLIKVRVRVRYSRDLNTDIHPNL